MIESMTSLYTGMEQSRQQTEISTAVLAKSIDAAEEAGENMQGLLQAATVSTAGSASPAVTDPMLGGRIDVTA